MFSEPFKKTEVHSMSKLDRLKKDGTTIGDDSGMNDAVAKTEAIRNWVSTIFEKGAGPMDTPKFRNNN
jgi:hypothetical protein